MVKYFIFLNRVKLKYKTKGITLNQNAKYAIASM